MNHLKLYRHFKNVLLLGIVFSMSAVLLSFSSIANITLFANDAKITGNLRLEDRGTEKATIHGWHNTTDEISWRTTLKKGNYKVRLNYSQPYTGSAGKLVAGNQELASLFEPTASWSDYQTKDLGILSVEKDGEITLTLKGIQLSIKDNKFEEALPDLHFLILSPTNDQPTSQRLDIFKNFKGKSLFNGKNFKGWEGNNGASTMKWFRIEEGSIVGGSLNKKIPNNEFLRYQTPYENFQLSVDFKMVNHQAANGGIQFRSIKHPDIPFEMYGYQSDIIFWKWGALYDESRRNRFLGTSLHTDILSKSAKAEGWNHLVIRAENRRIRIWLNGTPALDYFEYDPKIAKSGSLALQIHSGDPSELWYRNIKIQTL